MRNMTYLCPGRLLLWSGSGTLLPEFMFIRWNRMASNSDRELFVGGWDSTDEFQVGFTQWL